jgi:hypothetical protein
MRYYAQIIDERTWSGDDIFWPRGGQRVIVSERFREMCVQHAIRGVVFISAELYGYECRPELREDWDIRLFDETLAIVRTQNTDGRFAEIIESMSVLRTRVLEDPKFKWISELRSFGSLTHDVGSAASKAYYRLLRNP